MSVLFDSSESNVTIEYQEFPKPEPEDAATEKTPQPSTSSGTYEVIEMLLCRCFILFTWVWVLV